MFVLRKHFDALAGLDFNRQDLLGKTIFLDRPLPALMAHKGQLILLFAADIKLFGNIFCGHAHMDVTYRAGQHTDHGIDHSDVAHLRSKARRWQPIGCPAH